MKAIYSELAISRESALSLAFDRDFLAGKGVGKGDCWHDREAGGRLTESRESYVIGLVCILCILGDSTCGFL